MISAIEMQLFTPCARESIKQQAAALNELSDKLDIQLEHVCARIANCAGRVILSGIGKSGHIARKASSTFSSTGISSYFLHPSEASHGDLGMLKDDDIVIGLSKSGESAELFDLIQHCKSCGILLISITSAPHSSLAKASDYCLLLPNTPESCPLGLAPTTSTTMMLSLLDAIASSIVVHRKFRVADFKLFHPGGRLGKKLQTVSSLMYKDPPLASPETKVKDAVIIMAKGRMGCIGITSEKSQLIGIFTDGDLRRAIHPDLLDQEIQSMMTASPHQIKPDALCEEAIYLFSKKKIPSIFVCDDNQAPVGIIHMRDFVGERD